MAVTNTSKTEEKEGQVGEDVSYLCTSLDTLQIQHSSKEDVDELEETFCKIQLKDENEDTGNECADQEEKDVEENDCKILATKEETEEKQDQEKDEEELGKEKEKDKEKENEKEEEQGKEKEEEQEKEKEEDQEKEREEKQEDVKGEEKKVKEDAEKPEDLKKEDDGDSNAVDKYEEVSADKNESEDEESSDENDTEEIVLTLKKTSYKKGPCTRGPGVEVMSTYMYAGQDYGIDNYNYASQGYMPYTSPPYASSPGYQANCLPDQTEYMPHQPYMSPPNSVGESLLPSPMSMDNGRRYMNDLSSPEMGMNQGGFNFPDSPNSSEWDDYDTVQMPSPSMQMPTSPCIGYTDIQQLPTITLDRVLEAIDIVENTPQESVPAETLLEITQTLESVEKNRFDEWIVEGNQPHYLSSNGAIDFRSLRHSKIAEKEIKSKLNPRSLQNARMLIGSRSNESIVLKDPEGDTPAMIIACKLEEIDDFLEMLVTIVERVKSIDICCEVPVNRTTKTCSVCLKSDVSSFYSPLSMKNNDKDTVLTSIIKLRYPESIVRYICENLMERSADILHEFNERSAPFYLEKRELYPFITQYLELSSQLSCSPNFEPWRSDQ